jgi:hypothetical protein
MKHLKTYKIFESHDDVDTNVLRDILLEIDDDGDWKTNFWKVDAQDRIYYFYNGDKNTNGYVVIIETIRQYEEHEFEGLKPPPVVIETIKRLIYYMNSEGFTEHRITFEEEESDSIMSFDPDDVDGLSDLEVWSNNFIRIEFWK